MAGESQDPTWPLSKFYFEVDLPGVGTKLPFQEVTGLNAETQVIEYRAGNSSTFSPIKMPGIVKLGSVTLKKGIFVKDNEFLAWYKAIVTNTAQRKTVTIRLLDEAGRPAMTWTLTNAWPTKITGADLEATGNELAVETIELAHEGLKIDGQ